MGNGLAVIDFSSRIDKVHNSYKAGDHWERDLFIESSSFVVGVGAGAGILAVKAGSVALSLFLVATPIGWAGLIVGGVAVAGVAASASIGMNNYTKSQSADVYDLLLKKIAVK